MSVKAFLLIEAGVGKCNKVVTTLKGIDGVKSADAVTGPYDVIAVVEAERFDEIGSIVIQGVPGVSRIVTCLVLKEAVKKD